MNLSASQVIPAGIGYNYWFIDASGFNPQWFSFPSTGSFALDHSVFEMSHFTSGDMGEIIDASTKTSGTVTLSNSVILPDDLGNATTELIADLGTPANSWAISHVFYWGRFVASTTFGAIQNNETIQSNTGVVSMQDSILYSDLGGSTNGFFKAESQNLATITNANACSTCSYNAGFNYINTYPGCTACTNQANGYSGKYSSTPGTLDLDITNPDDSLGPGGSKRVNPWLTDYTRSLATFASAYLGHTASAGVWSSGTAYVGPSATTAVGGDVVSHTTGGIYFGKTILYHCYNTGGCPSGTANEPSVGANWRNYWELASLYYIRQGIGAGVTGVPVSIVDGSIGCTVAAPCGITQALVQWVINGVRPQNPKFRNKAHDSVSDIGPSPMVRIPAFGVAP
jgi:hypothetical protein